MSQSQDQAGASTSASSSSHVSSPSPSFTPTPPPSTPMSITTTTSSTIYGVSVKPVSRQEELDELSVFAKESAAIRDVTVNGEEVTIVVANQSEMQKLAEKVKTMTNADGDTYTIQCMEGRSAAMTQSAPTSAMGAAVLSLQRANEIMQTRMTKVEFNIGSMQVETRRNSSILTSMATKMGIKVSEEAPPMLSSEDDRMGVAEKRRREEETAPTPQDKKGGMEGSG